jgi:hypothetical protein
MKHDLQPLFFRSSIHKKHRDTLERIMFFNDQQRRFEEQLTEVITKVGFPAIVEDGDFLRIVIGILHDCQTIAVYDGNEDEANLLGILVFYRQSIQEALLLYIAVCEECSSKGEYAGEKVLMRLFYRFREDMKKLKGLEKIIFAYSEDPRKNIEVFLPRAASRAPDVA